MTNPIDSLDVAYKICTIIGVAGGSMWAAFKLLYRKSSKVVDGFIDRRTAASIDRNLASLNARAEAIQCEVKPNGGNSLKDLQVKQMDRFEAQDKMLAAILIYVKAVDARVTNIETRQSEVKSDLAIALAKKQNAAG